MSSTRPRSTKTSNLAVPALVGPSVCGHRVAEFDDRTYKDGSGERGTDLGPVDQISRQRNDAGRIARVDRALGHESSLLARLAG